MNAQTIVLPEQYGQILTPDRRIVPAFAGELEFDIKDVNGQVLERRRENNIVKIFMKEALAHRLPHSKVWDPLAAAGAGAWVNSNIDAGGDFSAKYICFGASFDSKFVPLNTADTRFYTFDGVTNTYNPIRLGPGAEFSGNLINAIPVAEPGRPLKRIERIYFEPSYQPAGTPYLQGDVRAMNNVCVMETTLRKTEYNGMGLTPNDFFTITEVALVAAKEVGSIGACECTPDKVFTTGRANGTALVANATGTATVTIDPGESQTIVNQFLEGDQIKITDVGTTVAAQGTKKQITPYYMIISKSPGGRDLLLDRVPQDDKGIPLSGQVGVFRIGFRILAHRVLVSPLKKSSDFEITTRWRILMN